MHKTLLAFVLLLLLSACSMDPNLAFIQGTWISVEAEDGAGPLEAEWQFSRGVFIYEQEIDTDTWLYSQGSYRLVESEGDVLMVELYDISGDRFTYENGPATFKIEIDREAGTIRINSRLFERAG
jgi:hypothetical protein